MKIGAISFAVLGLVKPAYYIFKFVRVSKGIGLLSLGLLNQPITSLNLLG